MQPPQNTGSFGAPAGGLSPELQAAIQRRSGATAMPNTQGSAGFNPATQPATPPQSAPSAPQIAAAPQANTPTNPMDFETRTILQALTGRLKTLSDIQKTSSMPLQLNG